MFHHQATDDGTERNADVEGGDIEARCHIHCLGGVQFGLLHHQYLQTRHVAEGKGAPHQHGEHRQHRVRRGEGEGQQHQRQTGKQQLQRRQWAHLVGQLATPDIADGDRYPVDQQDQAHRTGAKAAHLLQDGGEEGKSREGAAVTKGGFGVDQQQRLFGQYRKLFADGGGRPLGQVVRDQQQAAHHGDEAEQAYYQKGFTPAKDLTNPGAERYAGHQRYGKAAEHDGDGARRLLFGDQAGGNGAAHREEDPVRQSGEDAGDDQALVTRCLPGQQVAGGKECHQSHQQPLARHLAGERREHGGADGHPKGIEADQQARRGERDIELLGDGGDKPHDHKFGGADRKGTQGKGK